MCVIFVVQKDRPSEEMVRAGYRANDKGGGIAWREGGLVHWRKGLSESEMVEECAKRPIPYIAHFRIPSCGGDDKLLCHPFVIDNESALAMEGSTKKWVLFHNGHYHLWRDKMFNYLAMSNKKMPAGPWSDSRVMAYLAGNMGPSILEFFEEKIALLGPKEGQLEIIGNHWIAQEGNLIVSNDGYKRYMKSVSRFPERDWEPVGTVRHRYRPDDQVPNVTPVNRQSGGAADATTFRENTGSAGRAVELGPTCGVGTGQAGKAEQKEVQENQESAGSCAVGNQTSGEDGVASELRRWALAIQPKKFRTVSVVRTPVQDDEQDRLRRIRERANGFERAVVL